MNSSYKNLTHRTELVLGTEIIERIASAKVLVVGVGGVGSWCAEGLVRSGIRHMTVVDSDIICPTNLNRQLESTAHNLGKPKADEMRDRLLSINPDADIEALNMAFDADSAESFNLPSYDYVIDAIDSVANKVHLLELCLKNKITVFSSMGAGAKTDPSRIRAIRLSRTSVCPLARAVRSGLRKKGIHDDLWCVYSDESPVSPAVESVCGTGNCACCKDRDSFNETTDTKAVDWCAHKKRINGALVHITAIFGFTLASLVINDIRKNGA
ncbi:MAG TPA: tRNA threonylcarbamoyladenosine dehydratase [Spirochaetota bacterium]